jgi:hypothetical protein
MGPRQLIRDLGWPIADTTISAAVISPILAFVGVISGVIWQLPNQKFEPPVAQVRDNDGVTFRTLNTHPLINIQKANSNNGGAERVEGQNLLAALEQNPSLVLSVKQSHLASFAYYEDYRERAQIADKKNIEEFSQVPLVITPALFIGSFWAVLFFGNKDTQEVILDACRRKFVKEASR